MPYGYASPVGSALSSLGDSLMQIFMYREDQKRKKLLDEIAAKDRESLANSRLLNDERERLSIASLEDQRAGQAAQRLAGVLTPGQDLDAEGVETLKRGKMSPLIVNGQPVYQGMSGDDASDPVMQEGPAKFRGTAEQVKAQEDRKRQEHYLATLDPNSPEARALHYELMTDKTAPAGMFDRASQGNKPAAIQEYEYYKNEAADAGKTPMSFEQWQSEKGGGDRPYWIPASTGQGIIPFDARTGRFNMDGRVDLKPGETAQKDLTNAQSVLYTIGQIEQEFSPERVGPLKGRYNSMQLALAGELGDEGLAGFQSDVANLKNTVIALRTGAVMSVPEAERILTEVPDFNLPPDVFMARLSRARQYFQEWTKNRAKLAFGRTTTGDVDNMITPPPAPPTAAPAPGAAGRRRYNPVTGRVE